MIKATHVHRVCGPGPCIFVCGQRILTLGNTYVYSGGSLTAEHLAFLFLRPFLFVRQAIEASWMVTAGTCAKSSP